MHRAGRITPKVCWAKARAFSGYGRIESSKLFTISFDMRSLRFSGLDAVAYSGV